MSLLKKLHDAVVEEDAPVTDHATLVAARPSTIPSAQYVRVSSNDAPSNIQTSDEMRLKIAGAGPANVFSATLKSLSNYIPDEASRYKAAKDMLAAQGVTPVTISADITSILARLDNECRNFESAKSSKETSEVATREARLNEIAAQIQKLEDERSSVAAALVTAKQLIETKQQEFYGSANALKAEYQGSLDKIKTYLGA